MHLTCFADLSQSAPDAANIEMTQNKVYGVLETAPVLGGCGEDIEMAKNKVYGVP
jgi:hypothetical protein